MFHPDSFDLLELDHIIESYDFATDPVLQGDFLPVQEKLWNRIEHYGETINDFGHMMADHLRRTSLDGMEFLVRDQGFSAAAGRNFHAANLFHDLGKIAPSFDPHIWQLPHRPTAAERAEKRKHIALGPRVFEAALAEVPQEVRDHPHVRIVIPALQLFHHERANGSGPFGRTGDQTGRIIKTVCIADAKDGDMVRRGHQSFRRSEADALLRMTGYPEYDPSGKYEGAFDSLLDQYIRYRERAEGRPIFPVKTHEDMPIHA